MKIALLGDGFISWNGGREFLQSCAEALLLKSKTETLDIYLFIEEQYSKIGKGAFSQWLHHISKNISVVFYKDLPERLNELSIEVVIPSLTIFEEHFPIPWVGYIYDFQHKYFPQFFSQDEINWREHFFANMLSQAKTVIVSAKSVKDDIIRYYPETLCKVVVLPLATKLIPEDWLEQKEDVCKKYGLPPRYFLISNQFWIHKDHLTAFKALTILKQKSDCEAVIVCTGDIFDYRFPNYFNELKEKIKIMGMEAQIYILGYLPKYEQLQIMRKATALLQPTLFEGAPGGCAAREALLLNVPVILSDISVNQELTDTPILFFKAGCPEDMADKMAYLLSNDFTIPAKEETFIQEGLRQLEARGEKLLEAISYVI